MQISPHDPSPPARRALVATIAGYSVLTVAAAGAGHPFLVLKGLLVPVAAIGALRSRETALAVRDWFPFLSLLLFFDASRGAIFSLVKAGGRPVLVHYVIRWEAFLTGVPCISLPLQRTLRSPLLDLAAAEIHAAHFAFFLLFGLILWRARQPYFWLYAYTLLGIFGLGLVCYLLWPTAPPWMAAASGDLPPVTRIVQPIYAVYPSAFYASFDINPVAAMPSLHVAFPVACTLVSWRPFGRVVAAVLALYAAAVAFAVMYLGEHYAADVAAGLLLAACVFAIVRSMPPPGRSQAVGRVLAMSLAVAGLALLLEASR